MNAPPLPYPHAYERVKDFLKNMLKAMVEHIESNPEDPIHLILQELGAAQTVETLRHRLEAFWRNEWPFNNQHVPNGNPLTWWENLQYHNHARVLAVSDISAVKSLAGVKLLASCRQSLFHPCKLNAR